MKIPDEDALDWDNLIARTARRVSSDFPNVDYDDIYLHLWGYVINQREYVHPKKPGVAKVVAKEAKKQAWKYRAEHLRQTAQYSYRTDDVREILETTFHYSEWAEGYVPGDAVSKDAGAAIEVRADISWGIELLPPNYQNVIFKRYRDKIDIPADTNERRQLNRAIERLATVLNCYTPGKLPRQGPGNRRAISNAQARFIIEEQG